VTARAFAITKVMRNPRLGRLFERFRTRGSTAALAAVFDATAPALLRVARRITGDVGLAEDAVQSTFLAAIERAATWDANRPLEPWLFGILVRQLGALRRQSARVVDAARLTVAPPEDPATAAERSELVAAVDAALEELPERDRAVLRPWLADEARGVELAARLGVGGSTLRMRLQRGLARLRRALPVGFGAGLVVTTAERRALAQARTKVLAAAVRPGTALVAGASMAAKLATAAVLVVAPVVGGTQHLRS
jgi:RNA polymerase sigma-70 factor (ECF subfamily)